MPSGKFFHSSALFVVLLAVVNVPVAADEKPKPFTPAELTAMQELTKPGSEHKELASLAGAWDVEILMPPKSVAKRRGKATIAPKLGDRFIEIAGVIDQGPAGTFEHTLGFDRRHNEYAIVAMDQDGTYFVTGRGKKGEKGILMFGEDNDPVMTRMGLKKKFAFGFEPRSKDDFSVVINFVDTRTAEEKLLPFLEYKFTRAAAK